MLGINRVHSSRGKRDVVSLWPIHIVTNPDYVEERGVNYQKPGKNVKEAECTPSFEKCTPAIPPLPCYIVRNALVPVLACLSSLLRIAP